MRRARASRFGDARITSTWTRRRLHLIDQVMSTAKIAFDRICNNCGACQDAARLAECVECQVEADKQCVFAVAVQSLREVQKRMRGGEGHVG